MNSLVLNLGHNAYSRLRNSLSSRVVQMLTPALESVTNTIRQAAKSVTVLVNRSAPARKMIRLGGTHNDRWRQALNVLFAVGQAVTTYIVVASGADSSFTTNDAQTTTPMVPAGYAFSIWGLIYGSTIAYSVYQALPQQRTNALLRRIGWWTAPAFLGTSLWLLAASKEWYWSTVVIFFGILAALLGAFIQLIRDNAPRTTVERLLVVLPVSVYTGWASVATVANVSTTLKNYGYSNPIFADTTWAVIMLIVAGLIGSFVTFVSRGNIAYALTIIWALVGIVVANVVEASNPVVASVAGAMAAVVGLVLLRAQRAAPMELPEA